MKSGLGRVSGFREYDEVLEVLVVGAYELDPSLNVTSPMVSRLFENWLTKLTAADFIKAQASSVFGNVLPSYKPGVRLTDLATSLPDYAIEAIREALPAFDAQIAGFAMQDAVLTGVETRTSSPLRITRGKEDWQSLNVKGLYPAGEGAGYAGGIMSAGVDGIEVAEAVGRAMLGTHLRSA